MLRIPEVQNLPVFASPPPGNSAVCFDYGLAFEMLFENA
jgi:hypothetical protein